MAGWAEFPLSFADCAYYQGNYSSPAQFDGVIVNVARGNQGSYSGTTWGAQQVANVRAQGKDLGMYFFNGNLDAATCGKLFAQTCRSLGFNVLTDKIGIDCEDEPATGTQSWGPAQCQAFIDAFAAELNDSRFSWKNVLIYMNYTINRKFNWSQLVAWGALLWYARPGGPLDAQYWPSTYAKQDGLYQGVDANGYTQRFADSNGNAAAGGKGDMPNFVVVTVPSRNGACFKIDQGIVKYISTGAQLWLTCNGPGFPAPLPVVSINESDLQDVMYNYGLAQFNIDTLDQLAKRTLPASPAHAYDRDMLIADWHNVAVAPTGATADVDTDALAEKITPPIVSGVVSGMPKSIALTGALQ